MKKGNGLWPGIFSVVRSTVGSDVEQVYAIRRASVELNHKSGNDRLVSKALEVDIFSGKRALPVSIYRKGERL